MEITPFGGLSLFFKMLEKCHFEEHVIQCGIPLQGFNPNRSLGFLFAVRHREILMTDLELMY